MKHRRRLALASLLVCAVLGAGPARAQAVRGTLRLGFSASSTLHDFSGAAPALAVSLAQTASGEWSADVAIPVAELSTGNAWRDENMRSMFDAARHPRILGRVRGVDPEQVRASGSLAFVLRIREIEQPIEARVTRWQQTERTASFDAEFEVSLEAFGLSAPQLLFNRVGDVVRVSVRVELERT